MMLLFAYFSLNQLECDRMKPGGSAESEAELKTWPSVTRSDRKCDLPVWPPVPPLPCDMEN